MNNAFHSPSFERKNEYRVPDIETSTRVSPLEKKDSIRLSFVRDEYLVGNDEIENLTIAAWIVRYPCRLCGLWWLIVLSVAGLLIRGKGASFLFAYDDAARWSIGEQQTKNVYAWMGAVETVMRSTQVPVKTTIWESHMTMFSVNEGDQLLTVENVKAMLAAEQILEQGVFLDAITDNDTYFSFCVAYPATDERWPGCSEKSSKSSIVSELIWAGHNRTDSEWQDALDALVVSYASNPSRTIFFNDEFTDGGKMTAMRSVYNFGGPYPDVNNMTSSYSNPFVERAVTGDGPDQSFYLDDWYESWYSTLELDELKLTQFSTSTMDVWSFSNIIWDNVIESLIKETFLYIIIGIILVSCVIAFHTRSLMLTAIAMGQIMMSLPVAAFVYFYVFNITFWDKPNILTLFTAVGIGADDIFIFYDCWKQAGAKMMPMSEFTNEEEYYVKRMSYTFRKAGQAMIITTLTTCAAFFSTMNSRLPTIKVFGLFSGLVIIVDFLSAVTLFPVGIMITTRYPLLRNCGIEKIGKRLDMKGRNPEALGCFESFCGVHYVRWIWKLKFPIIVIFTAELALATWMTSQLTYPTGMEQMFQPGTGYATTYDLYFEWTEVRSTTDVHFVWGVNGLERDSNLFVSATVDNGKPR